MSCFFFLFVSFLFHTDFETEYSAPLFVSFLVHPREIRQLREQVQMAERSVMSGDESRRAVAEQAMRVREEVEKESAGLIERIGKLEVELQSVCSRPPHTTTGTLMFFVFSGIYTMPIRQLNAFSKL